MVIINDLEIPGLNSFRLWFRVSFRPNWFLFQKFWISILQINSVNSSFLLVWIRSWRLRWRVITRRFKPRDFLNRENSIIRVLKNEFFKSFNQVQIPKISCQNHVIELLTHPSRSIRTYERLWSSSKTKFSPRDFRKLKKITWIEWKHVLEGEHSRLK